MPNTRVEKEVDVRNRRSVRVTFRGQFCNGFRPAARVLLRWFARHRTLDDPPRHTPLHGHVYKPRYPCVCVCVYTQVVSRTTVVGGEKKNETKHVTFTRTARADWPAAARPLGRGRSRLAATEPTDTHSLVAASSTTAAAFASVMRCIYVRVCSSVHRESSAAHTRTHTCCTRLLV